MRRSVLQPNVYRAFPRRSLYRAFPVPYNEEALYIGPGKAQRVQLGQTIYPFREMFVNPESIVTAIRYKQDSGDWDSIVVDAYPSLCRELKAVIFTPDAFDSKVTFTLEVTATDIIRTRTVDILGGVKAGRPKIVRAGASVCPFFDFLFALAGTSLSDVSYCIDDGAKTAIPAVFGTELHNRARSFSLSFETAGDRRMTLYASDNTSEATEMSDSVNIRVT